MTIKAKDKNIHCDIKVKKTNVVTHDIQYVVVYSVIISDS